MDTSVQPKPEPKTEEPENDAVKTEPVAPEPKSKLDEAREAAEKEGAVAIEMSWNVNCDMDIHCFFLTDSGKFVKIFFSNPKYCVNCVAEEHASGTLRNCKCGPEYQIW